MYLPEERWPCKLGLWASPWRKVWGFWRAPWTTGVQSRWGPSWDGPGSHPATRDTSTWATFFGTICSSMHARTPTPATKQTPQSYFGASRVFVWCAPLISPTPRNVRAAAASLAPRHTLPHRLMRGARIHSIVCMCVIYLSGSLMLHDNLCRWCDTHAPVLLLAWSYCERRRPAALFSQELFLLCMAIRLI